MKHQKLKDLRKILDLTQQEMASSLNVSFVTLNRWENNNREIPNDVERLLACLAELVDYATKPNGKFTISEIQEAVKGGGVTGVIAGAVMVRVIPESAILKISAIPAFAWLSGIAGVGILGSMPFFNKLSSCQKGRNNKKR